MALLAEVGTYLDAATVSTADLTLGTNLFLGRMPDTPDTCVALYEEGGAAPVDVFGADTAPPVEHPSLVVHTRAAAYSTAQALSVDVMKLLAKVINEDLSSVRYYKVEPVQSPFAFERDQQDRMLFSNSFMVLKAL